MVLVVAIQEFFPVRSVVVVPIFPVFPVDPSFPNHIHPVVVPEAPLPSVR